MASARRSALLGWASGGIGETMMPKFYICIAASFRAWINYDIEADNQLAAEAIAARHVLAFEREEWPTEAGRSSFSDTDWNTPTEVALCSVDPVEVTAP